MGSQIGHTRWLIGIENGQLKIDEGLSVKNCKSRFWLIGYALLIGVCAKAEDTPNILFIVCDDLNTHVSTSGYTPIQTPTLEALASQSVTFTHAYCQYPVCGPSRASFLHGLYPESTGVLDNTADIRKTRPGTVSMPQFFKQHGYWTASVGKVFHSPRHEHGDLAWEEFVRFENDELPIVASARKEFEQQYGSVDAGKNRRKWKLTSKEIAAPLNAQTPPGHGASGLDDQQHKDGKNVRQVSKWINENAFGDKPFFIALGIQKPHVPFLAPQKYFDLYPTQSIQYQPDPRDLWDNIPRDAISARYKAFGFELGKENDDLRREYMQAYHACVSFVDRQIALVFDALRANDLWKNTIVIFTSDHGYHLGSHFMWGKVTLFDIGTRVPFIVRVPETKAPGTRSAAMIELIDIFPTLADLAGLESPHHLQGESFGSLCSGLEESRQKKYAYSVVTRRKSLGRAIRNQKWRYTKWPEGEELYDLTNDPGERDNLARESDHAEQLSHLRAALKATQTRAASAR